MDACTGLALKASSRPLKERFAAILAQVEVCAALHLQLQPLHCLILQEVCRQ